MPKVSVIMPAYNAEKYIGQAIGSILGQTFEDLEFIILNDCSKDKTEEIILSYSDERIVYVKNEKNLGVAGTLNRGLGLAKGEYIARMDADDISLPERLERQAAFLDENPAVAACGSNAVLFGEGMEEYPTEMPEDDLHIRIRLAISNPFVHPSMMLRAASLDGLRYDSAFEGREDYRMWMELSQNHAMANLPQCLLRYRIHGGQVTQKKDDDRAKKHFLLKKTYYRELDLGLTEEMQEVLCHAAFYGGAESEEKVRLLRQGLETLAKHYGCRRLPADYRDMLTVAVAKLPPLLRWRLRKRNISH